MDLTRRVFWPDTHAPYHDARAVNLALEVMADFQPHEVVILGDFFDCYSISRFDKDPNKSFQLLQDELEDGRALFTRLTTAAPNAKFIFLQGNHEWRIDRYVMTYAAQLGDIIKAKEVLKIPDGWTWIPYGQSGYYKMGKLLATHGSLCNKHVAMAMANRYGCSVLFGHTHRIQEFNIKNVHGERHKGVTVGWLGDQKRAGEYVQNVTDWQHAITLGWFFPDGDFRLQVIELEKYKCVANGKLYLSRGR